MNRILPAALALSAASCGFPIGLVDVQEPEVCVTRHVTMDATFPGSTPVPLSTGTGSQMGASLSGSVGTTVDIKDNVVDLPADAKNLIDLEVQIKKIQLTPSAINPTILDAVKKVFVQIASPAGSGLPAVTLLAYDQPASYVSGSTITATGQSVNLADYLYAADATAGKALIFNYQFDVTMPAGASEFDATVCIATKGHMEATFSDIQDFASGKKKL
jgi:hypothetical protein